MNLQETDHPPIATLENEMGKSPIIFVCEHASRFIPEDLFNLGLCPQLLDSHIASDPGALEVSQRLAKAFDAKLFVSNISRLVYDCNRPPDAESAVPKISEKYSIPGNKELTEQGFEERVKKYYLPFEKQLDHIIASNRDLKALITIHSFTPVYHDQERAVDIGILSDTDMALADALLQAASPVKDLCILANQPYGPADGVTHTLKRHGIKNGLLNVMIEIKNNLILEADGQKDIAELLAELLVDAFEILGQ